MTIFRAAVLFMATCAAFGSQARPPAIKVRLSHILIKIPAIEGQGTTQDEASAVARQRAEFVLSKAKSGADFGRLAKQYSEDEFTAENGGSWGWIKRGQMVAAIEDPAFSLKKGQISGIVQTAFGFHILRVDAIGFDHDTQTQSASDKTRAEMAAEHAATVTAARPQKWPRPDARQQVAVGRTTDELRAMCAAASTGELHPAYPNSSEPGRKNIAYECSILAVSMDEEYERLVDRAVRLQRELCTAGNGGIPESRPEGAQFASDWEESQATGIEWKRCWDEMSNELSKAELAEAMEREVESAELRQQAPNWDKSSPSQQEQLIMQRIFKAHEERIADLQKSTQVAKSKALRGLLDFGRVYSNCGHGW